jgi:hypothetical protein
MANVVDSEMEVMARLMANLTIDSPPDGGDLHSAAAAVEAESALRAVPSCSSRAEWVDLFVNEMSSAANVDDAKARTVTLLEAFEGASRAERDVAVAHNHLMKKAFLKMVRLYREQEGANGELQRQVAGSQERARELEKENHTLTAHLSQAQQRGKDLENQNFALTVHLKQAQRQGNSMPSGHFHPEVF